MRRRAISATGTAASVAISGAGLSRKVTASGVIWVQGQAYYVSRRLAGHVIPIDIVDGRLTIEVAIPLRKVYCLPKRVASASPTAENGSHHAG